MEYRAIGIMSGSSLDGLDIACAEFTHQGGKWTYRLLEADCHSYPDEWVKKLSGATRLPAREYLLLHSEYGHYLGQQVNLFIDRYGLSYRVALVASHGHTTFHMPDARMTAQLGDGSAIAAQTQLPVVSDLRALDVAFGGQGAPIVPIGEKLLMDDYDYFLNLGGIANISIYTIDQPGPVAFDICPANRVLNMLANEAGKDYDEGGAMAASGQVHTALLTQLNDLDYYKKPPPKSLANDFGTDVIYPMIRDSGCGIPDALRTCCEHIAVQLHKAISTINDSVLRTPASELPPPASRLLATGGGALNDFLVSCIREKLGTLAIGVQVPDEKLVNYKEALIMAFIGVLRWRQEYNVLSTVTGAARHSIGGALWTGQEA